MIARTGSAIVSFIALVLFIAIVYANPGNWYEGWDAVPFAKIAAAIAIAALLGSCLLYQRRMRFGGAVGALLIALFGLVGLSAAWSFWPSMTVDVFLDGLKYFAIFFLVVNVIDSPRRLTRIIQTMAWASLIPAIGAIISHARGEHLVEGDRAAWIGIFANPNDLAYHLVVGLALTLAARETVKHAAWRTLYLALLVPLGFALVLTQSRGGLIAAGVVVALWIVRSLRHAPALIGVAIGLGCVLYLAPGDPFKARADSSIAFGEDVSAQGRVDAWRTGLNMAAARPLTGVGSGAFMIAWPEFAPGDVGDVRTQHNTFIQMLSELGVFGLLLFVSALICSIVSVSRAARLREFEAQARGVQCGLAGFAVCSLSGGIAFTWPFYLLAGIAAATHAQSLRREARA